MSEPQACDIRNVRRRDVLGALGGAAAAIAVGRAAAAQQTALIEEPWSAAHLAGTLTRARNGAARGPAVLILAGSGPTPRDGSFGTYLQLAQGLAAAGIRSLRYDKRGVGGSRPAVTREDDLVLGHFVDDAILAARDLAARPDVSSVVMAGHSVGGVLAILAAAKMPLAAIVLLASPGRRFDAILREQIMAIPLPPDQEHFRKEALDILEKLARGERVPNVSPQQAALFRASVQPFLISMIAVDPAGELSRLTLPVLIMQGASDIQVRGADFEALTKARPDARKLLLPETNHVFKKAPADLSDRAAQLKSYDKDAPLVPGLVLALVEFVTSVAA